jgi:hypothetical protein
LSYLLLSRKNHPYQIQITAGPQNKTDALSDEQRIRAGGDTKGDEENRSVINCFYE